MRTLEQAKASWQELAQYTTVRELKDAVRLENRSSVATCGLRSFCWKTFLLFDTLDIATCLQTLSSSRSAYNTLRAHFLRSIDNPDDIGSGFDPLTQDAESSPWAALRKDEELRKEILQDVERCMPEHDYFRKADVQRMLLDILFVFCKLNPDVGYRQGMHELLAPVLWVIQDDAVDFGEGSKALGEDVAIANMYDAEHIEHDAFAVFGQIMQSSKSFYISDGPGSIASRSRYIFDDLLPQVDPDLKKHLDYLEVVPQVYLIRWIRLLFGREFDFSSVLLLWDAIFAEDASLEVVDFICVAMLLRIRWDVLDADYNGVLGLLLRYPEPDRAFPTQTLAFDALYLRANLTRESGSTLVMKYTGRPLLRANRPITPPALQRNITAFSGFGARRGGGSGGGGGPDRKGAPLQARNLEAMLRSTAKSIHARSEKLGIGKAVRSAVEEVHRKAQEIRETQVASPPVGWRRSGGGSGGGEAQLLGRLRMLESRNKRLSELLAGAVAELWEYQKLAADGAGETADTGKENAIEKLSAAIAQVQFVQVYLDEPSLALTEEGAASDVAPVGSGDEHQGVQSAGSIESSPHLGDAAPRRGAAAEESIDEKGLRSFHIDGLADPSSFDDLDEQHDPAQHEQSVNEKQSTGPTTVPPETSATRSTTETSNDSETTRPPRPKLEQSEFSFMLGQGDEAQQESRRRPLITSASSSARDAGKASLFGHSEDSRASASKSRVDGPSRGEGDDFDIGSLRRAPRAPK